MRTVFIRLILLTVPGCGPVLATEAAWTTTVYVGRHFEVRDHDQPTKYVFNGTTRVAAITGSLSANMRLQRLRLQSGWNLVSLAVTAHDFSGQCERNQAGVILDAYLWNLSTGDYSPIAPAQTVSTGAVLWLKAASNATLGILGNYADPLGAHVQTGGAYVPCSGMETVSVLLPGTASGWLYGTDTAEWETDLPGDLSLLSDRSLIIAPGEAFFVQTDTPIDLAIPDPALRIRYYHQDHLGSSSVVTDATGQLVEETAFYPFGEPRQQYDPRKVTDPYQFTQKEHDRETGLQYFEARHLAGVLGRFLSADPKYVQIDNLVSGDLSGFLADPQQVNLYDYVRNNPLRLIDPTGLDGESDPGKRESEEQLEKNEKYGQGGEAGIFGVDIAENLASHGSTVSEVAGGLSIALNVGVAGVKTLELIYHPSAKNAVSLGWHVTKGLGTYFAPEVFIPIQGGELALRKINDYADEKVASFNAAAKSLEKSTKELNRISSELEDQARQLQAQAEKLQRQTALLNAETTRLNYLKQQEDAADSKQFKEFWHQRRLDTIEYYHKYFGL